jgi:hypothetical protein
MVAEEDEGSGLSEIVSLPFRFPPTFRNLQQHSPLMDDTDTDTLIAIVQSLLEPTSRSTADILEALASSKGDCTAAARRLSSSASSSSLTKKHHHQPKVADWAKPKTDPADLPRRKKLKMSSSSFFSTSSANASNSVPNSIIDLTTPELSLSTLKQAPTKPKAPTASKPPASNKPLVLANSLLLEKHLPCIVVPPSPIPIYTASSLYLYLLKESESWAPITWWIGGKEVESPHTVRFFPFPFPTTQRKLLVLTLGSSTVILLRVLIKPTRLHA